jgi:hypothetical protein
MRSQQKHWDCGDTNENEEAKSYYSYSRFSDKYDHTAQVFRGIRIAVWFGRDSGEHIAGPTFIMLIDLYRHTYGEVAARQLKHKLACNHESI